MKKLKPYTVILSLEPEICCTYESLWMSHVLAPNQHLAIPAAVAEAALHGSAAAVLDYLVFEGHLREARGRPA